MSFIRKIFEGAVASADGQTDDKPVIYCDCGNTIFGSSWDGGFNSHLFHFLIALKKSGYDVRLMSDEPRRYTQMVKDHLKNLGLRDRFFQGEDGITITIKEAMGPEKALVVIDNNHGSHSIRANRLINPHDQDFIKDLKSFSKPAKSLPEYLKPENLFKMDVS